MTEPQAETFRALSDSESALAEELKKTTEFFAGKIGERNVTKHWELAESADALFERLSAAGYAPERIGYEVEGVVAMNIEAKLPGGATSVVVGAHYDTVVGSPGADDNTSGVAVLLSLAERFSKRKLVHTLRFVFFVNEEPPFFQTDKMGSLVYAKHLKKNGQQIAAMISVESVGYFSKRPGSQELPEGAPGPVPRSGDFIAVVGNEKSAPLVELVHHGLSSGEGLSVIPRVRPESAVGVGWSDHWSFWQIGAPAVMITDTAGFRNPHYHRASDLPDTLNYGQMARVVLGMERVIVKLAKESKVLLPNFLE